MLILFSCVYAGCAHKKGRFPGLSFPERIVGD